MQLKNLPIGSKVKFGKYTTGTEAPWPIKWEIVAKNHSGYPSNSVTLRTVEYVDFKPYNEGFYRKRTDYASSSINRFLQNDFLRNFTDKDKGIIKATDIYAMGPSGEERAGSLKVFLPSYVELGISLGVSSKQIDRTGFGDGERSEKSKKDFWNGNRARRSSSWNYYTSEGVRESRSLILETNSRVDLSSIYPARVANRFGGLIRDIDVYIHSGSSGGSKVYLYVPFVPDRFKLLSVDVRRGLSSTNQHFYPVSQSDTYVRYAKTQEDLRNATFAGYFWHTTWPLGWTDNDDTAHKLPIAPALNLTGDAMVSATPDREGYYNIVYNSPPVITANSNGGTFSKTPPSFSFTVRDNEQSTTNGTARIDDLAFTTVNYSNTSNGSKTYTLANDKWRKVLNGTHNLNLSFRDSENASASQSISFTKNVTQISFTTNPLAADAKPSRGMFNITAMIPTGANARYYVCNNGFDSNPTWEDITEIVNIRRHLFSNTRKTASRWGVKFKVVINRGTAPASNPVRIQSIGGVFD